MSRIAHHDGWLARLRRHGVGCTLVAMIGIAPMTVGCYGKFPLTRAVYRINGNVSDNAFVQSAVFWLFVIVPVYGVASFVDAIGMNLVEFWTGETVQISHGTDVLGNDVALVPTADGREATLSVSRDGRLLYESRFVRGEDGNWLILGMDGSHQGSVVRLEDGSFEVRSADQAPARTLPARLVASAAN